MLDAAARVVLRDSVSRLTLDAVAREAGVSKGGLLYHFPSKRDLIASMVEYQAVGRFERELRDRLERPDSEAGSWVRAYTDATFNPKDERRDLPFRAGLLAAAANDPELLETLRARYREYQERTENDGIDPALATIVRLASDGLWFLELLGLPATNGERREDVLNTLLKLTRNRSGPGAPT